MTIMPDTLKKGTYLWHKDSFFSVIKKKLHVEERKGFVKNNFLSENCPLTPFLNWISGENYEKC